MKKDMELAKQLWALGDPVRLKILRMLPLTADCEYNNNVSRIAEKLGLSQPTVSHHLRVLRQAGLVDNKKMRRDVFYWINHPEATRVVTELSELFESKKEVKSQKSKV